MRALLSTLATFLMAGLTSSAFALNAVYPLPPPNDTSLNAVPRTQPLSIDKSKWHHHQRHKLHRAKTLSCKVHPAVHHPRVHQHRLRQTAGIYLYYALPATACCGDTWQLRTTRCCAQPGVWDPSPYAAFKPAPEDFISNATNDDNTRPYDYFSDGPVDDSIENPDYY